MFEVDGERTVVAKGSVALSLSPRKEGSAVKVAALVLSRLTIYAGGIDAGSISWVHTKELDRRSDL